RSDVECSHIKTTTVDGQDESIQVKPPLSDEIIDRLYVAVTPPDTGEISDSTAPSMEYYRAKLALLRNELLDVRSSPVATAIDGNKVPLVETGPDQFYDASQGIEAVGILHTVNYEDSTQSSCSLILGNYADAADP